MRAVLQRFDNGRSPEEGRFVEKALALRPAGTVMIVKLTEEELPRSPAAVLHPGDFVVGNSSFVKGCVARSGLPPLRAPDYPACLTHLLHRRLWTATLGDAESESGGAPFYIKPANDAKAFNGEEATPAELARLRREFPASFPVSCSEKVDVACEFRVYVARGDIKAVAHCPHPGCEKAALDMGVVRGAVATLEASGEALGGYGIDFCVIKKDGALVTALMEVNDGTMCGIYDGISAEDYTDMVTARWAQLLGPAQ